MCPICKRPIPDHEAGTRHLPFCSKRCSDVDLGRWLTGSYAIPAVETDEDESASENDPETGEKGSPPN